MIKLVSMILLYGLVFLTPFLFARNTNELFEFPKMYYVYFAGSLLFVVTLLGRYRNIISNGFSRLAGLFLVSFALSTVLSSHPYTSTWGYFSRFNGGLVSVLVFFAIFLATSILKPPARNVLKVAALTILPISVYAILQHFGVGGRWASDTTVRAFSTFGQPNWYGAYCAMVLPIILYFSLRERQRVVDKVAWLLLFILGFCGFWFAYSISGIAGLAASILLLLVLDIKSVRNNLIPILITFLVCAVFAFLNPGIFKQKLDDALVDTTRIVQPNTTSQPQVTNSYVETPTYAVTDSGFIRKGIWEGTLKLVLSSPKNVLVGTGPETFPYEFQRFRPSSLNYSSEWNYILNKPHNYYLELLAQNGIIGLVIYLTFVIKILLLKHPIFTPALLGLFVTNIFGWPTVSTSLLFWIFLGLVAIEGGGREIPKNSRVSVLRKLLSPRLPVSTFPILLSAVTIAIYGYLNIQFFKQYLADVASKESDLYFERGDVIKALALANRSIKMNPHEPFYYRQRAKTYMLTTMGQSADEISYIKASTLKDLLRAREVNPDNLATLRGEISLYYLLALSNLTEASQQKSQDNTTDIFYLGLAKDYYQTLSERFYDDAGVLTQIAKYQKMLGLENDYQNSVERIRILRPDLLEWYLL